MTEPLASYPILIRKLTGLVLANLENENFGVQEFALYIQELDIQFYILTNPIISHSSATN
jgi:hypothetical protein